MRVARSLVVGALAVIGCSSQPPSDLKPEIAAFLKTHSEFGQAQSVAPMPDWAEGPRQQVTTTTGAYLFYMKADEVVTVYQNDGTRRRELWRKK